MQSNNKMQQQSVFTKAIMEKVHEEQEHQSSQSIEKEKDQVIDYYDPNQVQNRNSDIFGYDDRKSPLLENVTNPNLEKLKFLENVIQKTKEFDHDLVLTNYTQQIKNTNKDDVNQENFQGIIVEQFKNRMQHIKQQNLYTKQNQFYEEKIKQVCNDQEIWNPVDNNAEKKILSHVVSHKVRTKFKWYLVKSYFNLWKVTSLYKQQQALEKIRNQRKIQNNTDGQKMDIQYDIDLEIMRANDKYLNEATRALIINQDHNKQQDDEDEEENEALPVQKTDLKKYIPFCNDVYKGKN